jgi:hypothetical protein
MDFVAIDETKSFAGVEFVDANGGPGLRLRERGRPRTSCARSTNGGDQKEIPFLV